MSKNIKDHRWKTLFEKQKSHSDTANLTKTPERINNYFFIYNCFENSILYINTAFTTVSGFDTSRFNLNFMIDMIHPDDVSYFFNSEDRRLEFTNTLLFNEHFRYILSYTMRMKSANGNYNRILQECHALEVNNSGHLTKLLVIHKKINDFKVRPADDYKIFDKEQNIYIDAENSYNLSKRELEILYLIKNGLNSRQVAEALYVSKNTILTHRKNILKKTNSKSFIELVKKISYQGK